MTHGLSSMILLDGIYAHVVHANNREQHIEECSMDLCESFELVIDRKYESYRLEKSANISIYFLVKTGFTAEKIWIATRS